MCLLLIRSPPQSYDPSGHRVTQCRAARFRCPQAGQAPLAVGTALAKRFDVPIGRRSSKSDTHDGALQLTETRRTPPPRVNRFAQPLIASYHQRTGRTRGATRRTPGLSRSSAGTLTLLPVRSRSWNPLRMTRDALSCNGVSEAVRPRLYDAERGWTVDSVRPRFSVVRPAEGVD